MFVVASTSSAATNVGGTLGIELDDVVAPFTPFRLYCKTGLACFHLAVPDGEVLTGCEFHQLCCDTQGDGTLDLLGSFRASLRYTVCYHFGRTFLGSLGPRC